MACAQAGGGQGARPSALHAVPDLVGGLEQIQITTRHRGAHCVGRGANLLCSPSKFSVADRSPPSQPLGSQSFMRGLRRTERLGPALCALRCRDLPRDLPNRKPKQNPRCHN